MSKMFVTCKGKTACQEDDSGCRTCGRSLEEINGTRELINNLVSFVQKMEYRNAETFFSYIASKAEKKLHYL